MGPIGSYVILRSPLLQATKIYRVPQNVSSFVLCSKFNDENPRWIKILCQLPHVESALFSLPHPQKVSWVSCSGGVRSLSLQSPGPLKSSQMKNEFPDGSKTVKIARCLVCDFCSFLDPKTSDRHNMPRFLFSCSNITCRDSEGVSICATCHGTYSKQTRTTSCSIWYFPLLSV